MLVHDSLRVNRKLQTPFNEIFESLCLDIMFKGTKLVVSEIYRLPNSDNNQFNDGLHSLLYRLKDYGNSFICGDLNYDLLKMHFHDPSANFYSTMMDNSYVAYINKPNRVTHRSGTLIDNIFCKNKGPE